MGITRHLMVTSLSCALFLTGVTTAQSEGEQSANDQQEHRLIAADLLPQLAELTGKRVVSLDGNPLIQRIVISGHGSPDQLSLEAIYVAFVANGISTVETGNDIIVGSTNALLSSYSGFPVIGPGSKVNDGNPSALMVKIFSFPDEETAEAAYGYIRDVIDGGVVSYDSQRSQLAILGPAAQCNQIAQMLSASLPESDLDGPSAAKLLSVSFDGGTVSEYVDTLQKAHPKLSVLVGSDAGTIALPAIELHEVSARSALMVLSGLSPVGNSQEKIDVMETTPHPSVGGQPVFQIALHEHSMRGRSSSSTVNRGNELGLGPSVDWNVWSLRPVLTDHLTSADVLKTMRQGLAMVPTDGHSAELTYDEKTGLLMAAGTRAQIMMVNRMIENMQ